MAENPRELLKSAWKVIPKFPCTSVGRTAEFYTKSLHFPHASVNPGDVDASEATMCSVYAGRNAAANIYLFRTPPGFQPSSAMIALGTLELDKYYQCLVKENKVTITEEIEDKPWGYRQFEIQDIDGNRLQFFNFIEGGNPGDEK